MNPLRFDQFSRTIARRLPRRGLLAALGAGTLAALPGRAFAQATPEAATPEAADLQVVSVTCRPCLCNEAGEDCECCLNGITGGGIVRTETSDVTFVLFATAIGNEAERQAAGFVRWIDPALEGGMTFESIGPIFYKWRELESEAAREIRGTMSMNGSGEEPFVLRLIAAGADAGDDTAWLEVGEIANASGASEAFAYAAQGPLVGGDLQLLDELAAAG